MSATQTRTRGVCNRCDRQVIWAVTRNDKRMAIDPQPFEDGNVELVREGGVLRAHVIGRQAALNFDGTARYKPHVAVSPACRPTR